MAGEVQVRTNLQVIAGKINYNGQPVSFTGNMAGRFGPAPGAFSVPITGKDVDLSMFTTPGYFRIQNQDSNNYIEVGIKDVDGGEFYPMLEVLPGESYVGRFSRNMLSREFSGAGTGSVAALNKLHIKANTAAVTCLLETFES